MCLNGAAYRSLDIDNDRMHCEHWACDGSSQTYKRNLKNVLETKLGFFLTYLYHIQDIFRPSVRGAA